MDKKLERAAEKVRQAEEALRGHMMRVYPPGSRVGVRLKAGQMIPTRGTILESPWAYRPDAQGGTIRVRFDNARSHRRSHRDIHVLNIMEKYS